MVNKNFLIENEDNKVINTLNQLNLANFYINS